MTAAQHLEPQGQRDSLSPANNIGSAVGKMMDEVSAARSRAAWAPGAGAAPIPEPDSLDMGADDIYDTQGDRRWVK